MNFLSRTSPSTLHGTVLVASGAIGAGMFSLPVVASGMWFGWAVLGLCLVWLFNLLANLLLVEANLRYPSGASFSTIVSGTLGHRWNFANDLAIAFVMYILLYAYFSASGSIVDNSLSVAFGIDNPLPRNVSSLLFGLLIAICVWLGTAMVSRISMVFLLGMIITFMLSTAGILLHVEIATLVGKQFLPISFAAYSWAALPYFVTSFACAGLVPSLVKYYQSDPVQVKASLTWGTLISLVIYVLWVAAVFGSLGRGGIAPVVNAGGNMGELVGALTSSTQQQNLGLLINLFSNFAITTSFLSISLGLFDYIADKFKFSEDGRGRRNSALLTFLPPALLSFFFPNGFILAIGYAGLVVLFSFYLVPVVMAFKHRASSENLTYQLSGGKALLCTILAFTLIAATCKILGTLGALPVFP
ncbi:MAG: aromatic amino acid transporter [Pseudomonadota bacterium]